METQEALSRAAKEKEMKNFKAIQKQMKLNSEKLCMEGLRSSTSPWGQFVFFYHLNME